MALDDAAIATLRETFGGEVHRPQEPSYADALRAAVWNGDIDRQPALIVQPTTNEDVVEAIQFARSHGAALTVRGGGHGFSGKLVADGAVMIDLSCLNGVRVDPVGRRAHVGGGASWALVDAATAEHGLAVVGGTISHTGVAGLTLSGGMGWLTRSQGLACDNLMAATIVTADSRIVTASADENPDLYWGLRGAGANFGVVTELVFQLHEVNPLANLGLLFWAPAGAAGALRRAREYLPQLPDGMACLVAGLSAPPAPFVPEEYHGMPGFGVLVASWGDPEEHAQALQPLREAQPLFEFVSPIPYTALQQMLDESAPWGISSYEKGLYLDELTDDVIDVMVQRIAQKTSPLSFIPMFLLDGAFTAVDDMATAFGGARRRQWALSIVALALDDESFVADRDWVRSLWDSLRMHARDDGTYLNFSSEREDARVRASYGAAKYQRLAELKTTWDPENVFCNNANVKPSSITIPEPRATGARSGEPV